jgi:hypothetical protein
METNLNQPADDTAPVVISPWQTVADDPREETVATIECEYCGHDPCGCGG